MKLISDEDREEILKVCCVALDGNEDAAELLRDIVRRCATDAPVVRLVEILSYVMDMDELPVDRGE